MKRESRVGFVIVAGIIFLLIYFLIIAGGIFEFWELFPGLGYFENPEVVAIAMGLLVFIAAYTVLSRMLENGPAAVISLIFGIIGGVYLYKYELLSGEQKIIPLVFLLIVAVIIFKIASAFFRHGRRQFGR